ncbi:unnamed protein product [Orchesella dallaii]|uniref:Beta/gamma crystallin 'Greek key' domain-containing protein n=1 Tax=Orchesella dallaii TaxID=48710 RepID=A0ABP1RTD2_9HEXA
MGYSSLPLHHSVHNRSSEKNLTEDICLALPHLYYCLPHSFTGALIPETMKVQSLPSLHLKQILVILFVAICSTSHAATIIVYENDNFSGESQNLEVGWNYCTNLPGHWNDRVSSVNTQGACIHVYEHWNCEGRSERIAVGTANHAYLGGLGFNDMMSSVKEC